MVTKSDFKISKRMYADGLTFLARLGTPSGMIEIIAKDSQELDELIDKYLSEGKVVAQKETNVYIIPEKKENKPKKKHKYMR